MLYNTWIANYRVFHDDNNDHHGEEDVSLQADAESKENDYRKLKYSHIMRLEWSFRNYNSEQSQLKSIYKRQNHPRSRPKPTHGQISLR